MIWTRSPFLIFAAIYSTSGAKRDDLHKVLGAQLSRNGAKDTRSNRLIIIVDQDSGVGIKADGGAIFALNILSRADDHGAAHIPLFHTALGDRFLNRDDDDIADARLSCGETRPRP